MKYIKLAAIFLIGLLGCSPPSQDPVLHKDITYDSNGLATSLWIQTVRFPEKGYRIEVTLTVEGASWHDVSVVVPAGYILDTSPHPYNTRVYNYITEKPEAINSTFRFVWNRDMRYAKTKPTIRVG